MWLLLRIDFFLFLFMVEMDSLILVPIAYIFCGFIFLWSVLPDFEYDL